MMVVFVSLLTGFLVGFLFSFLKLPLPAPPTLAGVIGIFGVYGGYQAYLFIESLIK